MYHSIMFPLDSSSHAELAAPLAARIAKRDGARLHLVLVHQLAPNPEMAGWAEADEAMRAAERQYLARFGRDMLDCYSIEASTALCEGLPVRQVLRDFVRENGVDLVVMTTHGRTGLRRTVVGSVADGVLQDAHVPVLMVRPQPGRGVTWHAPFRTVFIPLDGSEHAEQVVEPALALATPDGATFVLVRVVEPVAIPVHPYAYAASPVQTDVEKTERLADEAKAYLADAEARIRHAHPEVALEVRTVVAGSASTAVLDLTTAAGAPLVALTTTGRGLARALFGGVADQILRQATCPLLVYRPRGD